MSDIKHKGMFFVWERNGLGSYVPAVYHDGILPAEAERCVALHRITLDEYLDIGLEGMVKRYPSPVDNVSTLLAGE